MLRTLIALGALTLSVLAQRGDRDGHDNMAPVVPEDEIPPAPVRSAEESLETFEIASGFTIEPVATEPLVDKPVCADFDPSGRMWICEMPGYMPDIDGKGESTPQGRIVVLEDTDGDGRMDQRTVFLEDLLLPRALHVYPDGLLFITEHDLCWVPRDGTETAGDVEIIDRGFAHGGNVEHKPNGLVLNLDNWLYLAKSDKRVRRVDGEWRIEKTAFRGQWGIARDDQGRLFHNNNSTFLIGDHVAPNLLRGDSTVNMKVRDASQIGDNRVWPIRVTPGVNRAYIAKSNGYDHNMLDPETHKLINTTAAAGMTVYRGTNFPESWYGTAFITESVAQLVKAIDIEEDDGWLDGGQRFEEKEFLAATDERFRPVNAYNAPDGSLYILDFYHGIIQHKTYMTSYLREQTLARDLDEPAHGHGRIYRVRHRSGDLEPPVDIASLEGRELLRQLAHPNAWHRETAQRVITRTGGQELVSDLGLLLSRGNDLARIHALWSLEGMGELTAEHVATALESGSGDIRRTALWVSTKLAQDQIRRLEPALTSMKPDDHLLPYLARALAACMTPAADEALAELLDDQGDERFVREAAVAGLAGREGPFLQNHLADSDDRQLVAWLEEGAKGAGTEKPGGGLEGDALASFKRGKVLYHGEAACIGCHGADGAGLPNLGPPLENSEWVTGDPEVLVKILLHGMTGPLTVDGETYNPPAAMPGLSFNPAMSNARIADISTYVRNEWGNEADPVEEDAVSEIRSATGNRSGRPYTAEDLK